MHGQEGPPTLTLSLQMLAISLSGIDANPQFVNPLTLSANGVTDESWVCDKGVQVGITESSFRYTNGMVVEATSDTLTFRQVGDLSGEDCALSLGVATRYISAFDADNWFAATLDFGGRIWLPPDQPYTLASLWDQVGSQMAHKRATPLFSTNVFYRYSDRSLSVNVSRGPRFAEGSIACSGSVHRDLDHSADQGPERQIERICAGWTSDWQDVVAVANLLVNASLGRGGSQ